MSSKVVDTRISDQRIHSFETTDDLISYINNSGQYLLEDSVDETFFNTQFKDSNKVSGSGVIGWQLVDNSGGVYTDNGGTIRTIGTNEYAIVAKNASNGPLNAKVFGFAESATSSSNKTSLTLAIAALPVGGGEIYIPAGTYLCHEVDIPDYVTITGEGSPNARKTSTFANAPVQTTLSVTTGSYGLKVLSAPDNGFSRIKNIRVSGYAGDVTGIIISSYDVHLDNVAVYGFTSGIGVKMSSNFRVNHKLDIQGCGLGLWVNDSCNAVGFEYLKVENCTMGVYIRNSDSVGFFNAVIEGNGAGKDGTSFPSTGLITLSSTILTDFGWATQADAEGGIFTIGGSATFIALYMEANSSCLMYAGLQSVINIQGGYINDNVGSPSVLPDYIIKGNRARSITFEGMYVSTDNTRTTALFDINTDRAHTIGRGCFFFDAGSLYTGTMYVDTANGFLNKYTKSLLYNPDGSIAVEDDTAYSPGSYRTSITLTSSQIKSLNSTPVTLIESPEGDKSIKVNSIFARITFGSAAYVGAGAMEFRYTNGSGDKVCADMSNAFITNGSTTYRQCKGTLGNDVGDYRDEKIVATSTTDFTDGDSTITLDIAYEIVDTFTKVVTLSSADILSLNTTPVEIIANPGASTKSIQVLSLTAELDFNSAAYVGGGVLQFRYDNAAGTKATADIANSFIISGTDATATAAPVETELATTVNRELLALISSSDPTTGDSPIDITIEYLILDGAES